MVTLFQAIQKGAENILRVTKDQEPRVVVLTQLVTCSAIFFQTYLLIPSLSMLETMTGERKECLRSSMQSTLWILVCSSMMESIGMDMFITPTHALTTTLQLNARSISPFMVAMNRSTVNMVGSGWKDRAIWSMLHLITSSSFIHKFFSILLFSNGHALTSWGKPTRRTTYSRMEFSRRHLSIWLINL